MDPISIATALPSILGGGGGLGGLFGGGDETEVTQSSSNTTSINLSSLLSNQSPNAEGGDASGSAQGSAQAAGGGSEPQPVSPLLTPISGFDSLAAEDNFKAEENPSANSTRLVYLSVAGIAGLGALMFLNRKKKRA